MLRRGASTRMHTADAIVAALPTRCGTSSTGRESFDTGERWRIDERVHRLNDLGFDIEELDDHDATTTARTCAIQPKVVDAGHHSRRLLRLTGLDVQENQARRLLNDLDSYRATLGDRRTPTRRSSRTTG